MRAGAAARRGAGTATRPSRLAGIRRVPADVPEVTRCETGNVRIWWDVQCLSRLAGSMTTATCTSATPPLTRGCGGGGPGSSRGRGALRHRGMRCGRLPGRDGGRPGPSRGGVRHGWCAPPRSIRRARRPGGAPRRPPGGGRGGVRAGLPLRPLATSRAARGVRLPDRPGEGPRPGAGHPHPVGLGRHLRRARRRGAARAHGVPLLHRWRRRGPHLPGPRCPPVHQRAS